MQARQTAYIQGIPTSGTQRNCLLLPSPTKHQAPATTDCYHQQWLTPMVRLTQKHDTTPTTTTTIWHDANDLDEKGVNALRHRGTAHRGHTICINLAVSGARQLAREGMVAVSHPIGGSDRDAWQHIGRSLDRAHVLLQSAQLTREHTAKLDFVPRVEAIFVHR